MSGQTHQTAGLGNRALVAVLAVLRDTRTDGPARGRKDATGRPQAGAGTPAPRPAWK